MARCLPFFSSKTLSKSKLTRGKKNGIERKKRFIIMARCYSNVTLIDVVSLKKDTAGKSDRSFWGIFLLCLWCVGQYGGGDLAWLLRHSPSFALSLGRQCAPQWVGTSRLMRPMNPRSRPLTQPALHVRSSCMFSPERASVCPTEQDGVSRKESFSHGDE